MALHPWACIWSGETTWSTHLDTIITAWKRGVGHLAPSRAHSPAQAVTWLFVAALPDECWSMNVDSMRSPQLDIRAEACSTITSCEICSQEFSLNDPFAIEAHFHTERLGRKKSLLGRCNDFCFHWGRMYTRVSISSRRSWCEIGQLNQSSVFSWLYT